MGSVDTPKDDILSYAGDAINRASDVIRFFDTILGFVQTLWVKHKKEKATRDFEQEQIRRLREEMGALGALAKEMERQIGRGDVRIESLRELIHHVKNATKVSRDMGIHAGDPDFELRLPPGSSISNLAENEPALLVVGTLLDEISQHSNYHASHMS